MALVATKDALYPAIEAAVTHAPIVSSDFSNHASTDYSQYKGYDDYKTIFFNGSVANQQNVVGVRAAEGLSLSQVLYGIYDVLGSVPDKAYIDDTAKHEQEHYEAAKRLGHVAVFAVELFQNSATASEMSIRASTTHEGYFCATKLMLALIAGRPRKPSDFDMENVTDLGYTDIEEISELAMHHNKELLQGKRPYDFWYPIPYTYSKRPIGLQMLWRYLTAW